VALVKQIPPFSKRDVSPPTVAPVNTNSILGQALKPSHSIGLPREKQTEMRPDTNVLFETADKRWLQPIFEEPFAQFRDWTQRYLSASENEKALLEAEGVELCRSRRKALARLIQSDPERALQLSVPIHVPPQMPPSVRSQLEERVSGRGQLAVFGALPAPGKEKDFLPTFRTATIGHSEFKAFVYGRRLGEPTCQNIPLNGIAVDNLFAVNEHPLRILENDEVSTASSKVPDPICAVSGKSADARNERMAADIGGTIVFLCGSEHAVELDSQLIAQESSVAGALNDNPAAEPSSWTEGLKSVILIRVDFSDLPGAPLEQSTASALLSNVNAFYAEMSYGRAGIAPTGQGSDVTPTFRLTQTAQWYGTNNNYNQLRADARSAAAAAGYNLAEYDRDVICFGAVPNFNWSGLAYVGASGAWLHDNFSTGVAAHELGHNLGLNHANFWDTSGQSVIGPGTSVEYGDPYDTMGSSASSSKHFNVRNKAYLSWLKTNEWIQVTSNGTYRIFAQDDSASSGVRGLQIVQNSNTNYWVEFRQKIASRWLMAGAGLRRARNGNQQSQLLDTTAGSSNGKNDSCIVIGRTFSDKAAGIHITPVAKGGTIPESLDVVVNLGLFATNQPPVLHVNAVSTAAAPSDTLGFNAFAQDYNGDSLAYFWDFGDNAFGTNGPAVFKSWGSPGEYIVRCTVSDMKGGIASESKIITIGAPSTYRISGVVNSSTGPLQGVRVYVSPTQMAYTDSDGSYAIVGLAGGSYTVKASFENYNITNSTFLNPITVGPNATDVSFIANYSDPNAPSIVAQPLSQTISVGSNVTFSVGATGSALLAYQWRLNGSSIVGATNSSYTRANVQLSDAGNYSVVVTNVLGIAASANAVLTVNLPQAVPATLGLFRFLPGGQPQFTIVGNLNDRYIIEFSSNLLDWIEVTNVSGMAQYIDMESSNRPRRFYRSKLAK